MRLQHRPVPDDELCDRTVVVRPHLQVQPQVRGIRFDEQRFFRDSRLATSRLRRDHHAGRRAPDLVVGYDVRLIRLTARQVLRGYKNKIIITREMRRHNRRPPETLSCTLDDVSPRVMNVADSLNPQKCRFTRGGSFDYFSKSLFFFYFLNQL